MPAALRRDRARTRTRRSRSLPVAIVAVIGALVAGLFAPAPALAAVPVPGPNEVVITVKVGGDRAVVAGENMSDIDATGVAGVQLRLGPTSTNSTAWASYPWATCTSDADGQCSFVVPVTVAPTSASAMNVAALPWVHQLSAAGAPGWRLLGGPFSAGGNRNYVYQLSTVVTPGSTYDSTDGETIGFVPFMKRFADATATLSQGFDGYTSNGRWMVGRENPTLSQQCGIDVAVVMDVSSSIGAALPQAKAALDALVNSLTGTPSNVALFNFNTTSPGLQSGGGQLSNHPALMPVRTAAQAASVKSIYSGWGIAGSTNWDRALQEVSAAAPTYDVAVVLTDGQPTIHSTTYGGAPFWGNYINLRSLEAAVFSANAVKSEGTRVVPFYVGTGVTAATENNLRAISGPVRDTDFFVASNYTAAAAQLAQFAQAACQSSVQIEKRIVDAGVDPTGMTKAQLDAVSTPAPGWIFDASATSPAFIPGGTTEFTTGPAGTATVPLQFTSPNTSGAFALSERQQTGYRLVEVQGSNGVCTEAGTGTQVPTTDTTPPDSANPGFRATASAGVGLDCVVYNQPVPPDPATVTLTKLMQDLDGQNPQPRADWTLGAVVTATTGTAAASPAAQTQQTQADGTTSPWTIDFGTADSRALVTVSEASQPGYTFVSGSCTITTAAGDATTQAITDPSATAIAGIAPGDSVECTFVNRPLPGTVEWQKVDAAATSDRLAGSEWSLTGPGGTGPAVTVIDCEAAPCSASGIDTDPRPGYLSVTGLEWGTYTLVETAAPDGYLLDSEPRPLTIAASALTVDLGPIENAPIPPLTLPLTGGTGPAPYLLGGGALLLLALVIGAMDRVRGRRSA